MHFQTDDDTIPKGGAIESHIAKYLKACDIVGLKNVCEDLEGYLLDAGFVDVRVVVKKIPIGPWPKETKKKVCACLAHVEGDLAADISRFLVGLGGQL